MLLEYAKPANISVVIENHGGVSNDPDWMVDLMKKVNNPLLALILTGEDPHLNLIIMFICKKHCPMQKECPTAISRRRING